MRKMTALISTFSLILLLAASQAMADATASCVDGATVTVVGKVLSSIPTPTGVWLFVDEPSWDCGRMFMFTKVKGTCKPGSNIQASGTLSKHDNRDPLKGWVLNDGSGKTYNSTISCK
jgi:hypothetical protein